MKRMLRDWIVALVVGVGVFLAVDWISSGADSTGDPAPAFELVDARGGSVALAGYAGKPVILNFWGSWCGPCRSEIPEFAEWAAAHPDVPILGIAYNSGSGLALQKDAERLGVTWTVLESDAEVLSAYGVNVFPTTLIVDAAGTIRGKAQGAIGADDLDQMLAAAE